MTDASPMSPAEAKDLAGERIVAAVLFARAVIEAIWNGEITDEKTAADIQATARSLHLTTVREPTDEERADPEWWGHDTVDHNQLIEVYDPTFALILDHMDEQKEQAS